MSDSSVLQIDRLTVSYRSGFGKERVVLNDFNLDVKKGEIMGLLGPNGAGKTTLIKAIVSLIRIKSGRITVFGEPYLSKAAKRRIGYMPEVSNYYWFLTPEEILRLFANLCGMERARIKGRIDEVLALTGLSAQKRELVSKFSKGMQERLNIAQALLHGPELLILDEPFSGLDPLGRIEARDIFKNLKERGATIMLSSHELSEAELICDHVSIMKDGRLLKHGALKELLEERRGYSLEEYFLEMIR